jgi:predicted RNA-binding Zn-ribbon protein involved in translation (DUF1610 family)
VTDSTERPDRRFQRRSWILVLCLGAMAVLLGSVLFSLLSMSIRGVTVHVTGTVRLADVDQPIEVQLVLDTPISLVISDQPVRLVASGSEGEAIETTFSVARCPACGEGMIPVRWNLWNGMIEWSCPSCDEADARGAHE